MKISVLFLLLITQMINAQNYTIERDENGDFFPKRNNTFIKNIKASKNDAGKWALLVDGKAVTGYNYDVMHIYDYKALVTVGLVHKKGNEKAYKYGLLDKMGKSIIPCEYDEIWNEKEGARIFKGISQNYVPIKGQWGYVDNQGKIFISCSLDYVRVEPFNRGYAKVLKGKFNSETYKYEGEYGFIDSTGKETVPCKLSTKEYSHVSNYSDGMVAVEITSENENGYKNKFYGYCNAKGQLVIPAIYDEANEFINGMSHVKSKNRKICGCGGMYLNKKGKEIFPSKKEISDYFDQLFQDR